MRKEANRKQALEGSQCIGSPQAAGVEVAANFIRWTIYSPEYKVGAGWFEPPEYGADVIEIEAETKRDALILGVKAMLADHRHYRWCRENRDDGKLPFAGLKVERSGGDCPYDCYDAHAVAEVYPETCTCCLNGHVRA